MLNHRKVGQEVANNPEKMPLSIRSAEQKVSSGSAVKSKQLNQNKVGKLEEIDVLRSNSGMNSIIMVILMCLLTQCGNQAQRFFG